MIATNSVVDVAKVFSIEDVNTFSLFKSLRRGTEKNCFLSEPTALNESESFRCSLELIQLNHSSTQSKEHLMVCKIPNYLKEDLRAT